LEKGSIIKLTDESIIEIYKKRWNIEQGYKELREYFGFGKEENRIYEAKLNFCSHLNNYLIIKVISSKKRGGT